MFLKKLHHHFLFFFLSFVLLAQSLIFVVSQAVPFKNYELKSTWLSPQNSQTLVIGQNIDLRAKFEVKDKKIGSIYFVLSDPNKNFVVNFETQKNTEDIYTSLSSWDTAEWPEGIFNLNAKATIIDEQGKIIDEQESTPLWVKLIPIEEYLALRADNTPSVISDSAVSLPGPEDDFGISDGLVVDSKNNALTTTENPTSTATSTPNDTSTSTLALSPSLELISPEASANLSSRNFLLRFLTNFSAESVSYEFINTDNTAISTGSLVIEKTDGYNWVKNVELNETFINGSYKLLINILIPGENLSLTKNFDYYLYVPNQIKPEDLIMNLVNLQSNVQSQVGLRAEANLNIDNLDFVIEDSINHVEALRIKGINNSNASSTGASFLAVWDTAVLPNGNYLVYVESKIDQQKVGSVKQLVTTYNPNNNNQPTSTPTDLEIQGGPNDVTTPTSTVSVANSLTPSDENNIDCQRSGISDQILCQKYQAELNNSLPLVCRDKNILVGVDCEKYIFENEANICASDKVEDATKCRQYLYDKYSSSLFCDNRDAVECQKSVTDSYIARLAYMSDQKSKYTSIIDKISDQGLTLNSLNDQLVSGNLGDANLPLMVSDKYIKVLKIKNINVLDIDGNLFISSPAAIMGDKDGDSLPDDLESYYNTDVNKADTDGDGFNDGPELFNNYNPLGVGKLQQERTALDQVLLSKLALEEPKSSVVSFDNNWVVSEANSVDGSMQIAGKAIPNTWVNIFVYSQIPLLATVKSDTNGSWSYSINDPLTEGVHQVYVASNDKDGKLLARSEPLTFLVANIKNESAPVGVGQEINVTDEKIIEINWTTYYIIGGAFVFLVLVGLILLLIKRHRRRPDNLVLQATEAESGSASRPVENTSDTVNSDIKLPETPIPSNTLETTSIKVENKDQENHA